MSSEGYQTVARVGAVVEGQGRPFQAAGRAIALFLSEGAYYALDDVCPHQGFPLNDGIVCGATVSCLAHDWRFDLNDGSWFEDAHLRVRTYPVRVVGDEIQVDLG